jgi:hypothetical protein
MYFKYIQSIEKNFFIKTSLNEVWNLVCHITGRTEAEGVQ